MRAAFHVPAWVGACRLALVAIGLSAGLTACATDPEQGRLRAEQEAAQQFAARGYQARHAIDSISVARHRLALGGAALEIEVLSGPRSAARKLPLVVYLPGLGESAQAGDLWRMAWARAGYAVLSTQLLSEDATAWQSELARAGEFKALGRQRFADGLMRQRLQLLALLLQTAQRQAAAGDALWQGMDLSAVALAGFDMGAYTALLAAGERMPGQEAVGLPMPVRAAIALSPFAAVNGAANAGDEQRYGGLQLPVLSMTSTQDGDPLGLQPDAHLRRLPFEQMPAPDKYLLVLDGGGHALLAGNAVAAVGKEGGGNVNKRDAASNGGGRREGRSGGGGPGGEGGAGGGHKGGRRGAAEGSGGAGERGARGGRDARPLDAHTGLLKVAAQAVSIAFLDAYLSGDMAAKRWLGEGAAPWLDHQGQLQRK